MLTCITLLIMIARITKSIIRRSDNFQTARYTLKIMLFSMYTLLIIIRIILNMIIRVIMLTQIIITVICLPTICLAWGCIYEFGRPRVRKRTSRNKRKHWPQRQKFNKRIIPHLDPKIGRPVQRKRAIGAAVYPITRKILEKYRPKGGVSKEEQKKRREKSPAHKPPRRSNTLRIQREREENRRLVNNIIPGAQPEQPALRRSTRARRAPERFGYTQPPNNHQGRNM